MLLFIISAGVKNHKYTTPGKLLNLRCCFFLFLFELISKICEQNLPDKSALLHGYQSANFLRICQFTCLAKMHWNPPSALELLLQTKSGFVKSLAKTLPILWE
jgi:hypothetical protein